MGFIALCVVERLDAPRGPLKVESGLAETTVRLTLHTDFALRVLIQVGLNDGKLTTIKDIAQTFDTISVKKAISTQCAVVTAASV